MTREEIVARLRMESEDIAAIAADRIEALERENAEKDARISALGMSLGSLLNAVSRIGYPMSDTAWRNTGDDAPVNQQISVEARDLHRESARASRLLNKETPDGE